MPFDFEIGYRRLESLTQLSTQEIRERIRATGLVPRFETGLIEPEEFVEKIAAALGISLTTSEFAVIWNSIFLSETLVTEEMLEELKRSYRLILLSNTNAIHFEGLEANYPILRHFDHQVLSHRVKMMKPDPGIYLHAATLAECSPEECLFIDDLPENVEGARAVGMHAVVFRSAEELNRDFERFGVLCAST